MKFHVLNRRFHYWLSVVIALPLVLVIASGVLLQLKKQLPWVQPPEQKGSGKVPTIGFDQLLEACRRVPGAGVETWSDVNRVDVRPSKGMMKVWAKSNVEIQVDAATGTVLQAAERRSDFIESLHDGSYFGETAKSWVFLPVGLILLILWASGLFLFVHPFLVRARRHSK